MFFQYIAVQYAHRSIGPIEGKEVVETGGDEERCPVYCLLSTVSMWTLSYNIKYFRLKTKAFLRPAKI